jgi:nucleotide-binding universal stress UspA family protein
MANRILVPLDGSVLGDRILGRLTPIARDGEVTIELLAVIPEDESGPARRHLQRVQGHLKERGIRAEIHVRKGDPATEILRAADRFQPELIAMSSHGRSGPARWFLGSVAERVLRRARHPVLVANPGGLERTPAEADRPFRTILVPLDGSKRGAEILDLVEQVADAFDSEIVLLHVAPETTIGAPLAMPPLETVPTEAEAAALVAPAQLRLEKAGRKVRTEVRFGHPAEQVLAAAADTGADLIAMATHGHSGLERWVFGSVAEKVLRASPVPLLVKRTVTSNWSVGMEPPTAAPVGDNADAGAEAAR